MLLPPLLSRKFSLRAATALCNPARSKLGSQITRSDIISIGHTDPYFCPAPPDKPFLTPFPTPWMGIGPLQPTQCRVRQPRSARIHPLQRAHRSPYKIDTPTNTPYRITIRSPIHQLTVHIESKCSDVDPANSLM